MTKEAKCKAIIEAIVDTCNTDNEIYFTKDNGGFTLSVFCHSFDHYHIGEMGGTLNSLIDDLYTRLVRE